MNQGEQVSRAVQNLLFCKFKQIRFTQGFVSCFIYETDATFNINERQMSLSILVGVLNTSKIFLFAFCFITSEAACTFEFIEAKLDELFFYNSLCPKVIYSDFAKGLAKTIATRKTQRQIKEGNNIYILQLYDCHGVEAIKRHLVTISRYPKVEQDKIIQFI